MKPGRSERERRGSEPVNWDRCAISIGALAGLWGGDLPLTGRRKDPEPNAG